MIGEGAGRVGVAGVDVGEVWVGVLERARESPGVLPVLLESAELVSLARGQAEISVRDAGVLRQLEPRLPRLGELIAEAGGGTVTPALVLAKAGDDGGHDVGGGSGDPEGVVDPALLDRARRDPAVRAAMDLFDATVTDVRLRSGDDDDA